VHEGTPTPGTIRKQGLGLLLCTAQGLLPPPPLSPQWAVLVPPMGIRAQPAYSRVVHGKIIVWDLFWGCAWDFTVCGIML